jgi:hypothetical protein
MHLKQEPSFPGAYLFNVKHSFRISISVRIQGNKRIVYADCVSDLTCRSEALRTDEGESLISTSSFIGIDASEIEPVTSGKRKVAYVVGGVVGGPGIGDVSEDEPIRSCATPKGIDASSTIQVILASVTEKHICSVVAIEFIIA